MCTIALTGQAGAPIGLWDHAGDHAMDIHNHTKMKIEGFDPAALDE